MVLSPGLVLAATAGPPTSFALRMRPWLVVVLTLLMSVAAARFLSFDIMGGFFVALTVVVGWYAIKEGMDIAWLLCLAVVFFLNAIFDAFILFAHVMHARTRFMGESLPWYVNAVRAVLIAGPIIELAGAGICWNVYKDHLASLSSGEHSYLATQAHMSADLFDNAAQPPASYGTEGPQSRQQASFSAFQGHGHRL
mmetsp:Transcript_82814/g.130179  ORF Transcript_82814/g.130179 Transcript_82814/m.130179 type:complete len:196 (-) Transcript_82814:95-682(-)